MAFELGKRGANIVLADVDHPVTAMGSLDKVSALMPGPYIVDMVLFNSGRVRLEDLQKYGGRDNESGINLVEDMRKMAAEWGIEVQFTHPDEVAAPAKAGLEEDAFWLGEQSPETADKSRHAATCWFSAAHVLPQWQACE